MPLAPAREHDLRSLAGRRLNTEVVRQPLGAGKPETQAGARGVAIGHRAGDIRDARPLIDEGQAYAAAYAVAQRLDLQHAAAAIFHGVARDLAGRGDQLGLIDKAEPGIDRPGADRL